ncbi:flagellar hook-associated protein FlgL [Wenzhouxiangella sp. AB-CW3]|uniref:flagellar hook-associated protein FlgL n=1 Tax=Wenzhouxiangella sp. AB-CW3 TaxID=2771012 RepID=UPI00168AFB30|nr:flagellar hook-associated protein FlgL [Wenzhouxiangella sp. AB-CW3]QOC21219.1 flagellar hook-associated protein FlgL [Wenzhouxiangella sp. AB-CW3]
MRVSTQWLYQSGLNGILGQQSNLNQTQLQLTTGRRINNPSDDPVGAARLQELERSVKQQEVFQKNIDRGRQRMGVAEQALSSTGNTVQRARELAVQAANDTLGSDQRAMVAAELRQRVEEMLLTANSQDGGGEYIFAGSRTGDKPFVRENGEVVYRGDSQARELVIGPGTTAAESLTGDQAYMRIRDGNGIVRAEPGAGNTGSGVVQVGQQVDQAVYDGGTYTLQFAGPDPDDWQVVDSDTPPNVVATGTFEPDSVIAFQGVEITIGGQPEIGDEFVVEPARNTSIFATVENLAAALEQAPANDSERAAQRQTIDDTLAQFDRFENQLLTLRADLGARMNTFDDVEESHSEVKLSLETLVSEVRDLDYAEAISRFQFQQTALQAAQQSFMRVQQLNLFNFMG